MGEGAHHEDIKLSLVDAVTELIAAHGIEGFTVSDVTGKVGIALGSFYRYFDSKEQLIEAAERLPDLVHAVVVALLAGQLVELAAVVERSPGALEIIDDLLERRLLAQDLLRVVVVAPELGIRGLGVQLL